MRSYINRIILIALAVSMTLLSGCSAITGSKRGEVVHMWDDPNWLSVAADKNDADNSNVSVPIVLPSDLSPKVDFKNSPQNNFGEVPYKGKFSFSAVYCDEYEAVYSDKGDGSVDISFDAYNNLGIYASVIVFDKSHSEISRVSIDKYTGNINSLESWFKAGWKFGSNIGNVFNGNTYRLNTSKTHVQCNIPKGGYLVFTVDPSVDRILEVINGIDVGVSLLDLLERVEKINVNTINVGEIAKKLTSKRVEGIFDYQLEQFSDLVKSISNSNGDMTAEQMITFASITTDILKGTNWKKIGVDMALSGTSSGAENWLIDASGIAGQILNGVFGAGEFLNIKTSVKQFGEAYGVGCGIITNN